MFGPLVLALCVVFDASFAESGGRRRFSDSIDFE
jgi:hypothetical protein